MTPADRTIVEYEDFVARRARSAPAAPERQDRIGRIAYAIETVTPDAARAWLATAVADARRDPRAIAAYAEAMREGRWIVNAMPLVFDEDGRLIDGVQRLEACLAAQPEAGGAPVTFPSAVARNVSRDSLHTLDQHRRRAYTGVLETRGVARPGAVMRLMSKMIRIEHGTLLDAPRPIGWSLYDRVFFTVPDDLVRAVALAAATGGGHLPGGARAALAFMAIRAGHKTAVRDFLAGLTAPEAHAMDTPLRMLALQLEFAAAQNHLLGVNEALALAVLAFNDTLQGRRASRPYAWRPDAGPVPLVAGYPPLSAARLAAGDGPLSMTVRELRQAAGARPEVIAIRELEVTPETALDWLDRFNRGNRRIQQRHVRAIARDIAANRWMVNAQPICFSGDPFDDAPAAARLLNGQHRLMACVEAGGPIVVPVAVNLPDAAFATYDLHARRALPTKAGPKVDPRVLTAAARFQWRVDQGLPPEARLNATAGELRDTLERHPDLGAGFALSRRMMHIASTGVLLFLVYHVRRDRHDLAEEFLTGLDTGENLARGNPLLGARNRLIKLRRERSRKDVLGMLLGAWADYCKWRDAAPGQRDGEATATD